MDAGRFDRLVKSLSAVGTRRGVLRRLAALAPAGVLAVFLGRELTQANGSGAIVGGGGKRRQRRREGGKRRRRRREGNNQEHKGDTDRRNNGKHGCGKPCGPCTRCQQGTCQKKPDETVCAGGTCQRGHCVASPVPPASLPPPPVCTSPCSGGRTCQAGGVCACPAGQADSGGLCATPPTCQERSALPCTAESCCSEQCIDTTGCGCSLDGQPCQTAADCCAEPDGAICRGFRCNLCPASLTRCGEDCIDLRTDAANCGSCGAACAAGQVCEAGTCVSTP